MKRKHSPTGKKRFVVLFFLAVLLISVFAVFGDKGLVDVYRLKRERDRILRYNASLDRENRGLEREIELLKTDRRHIESIAREELGMIGRDEVLYMTED